MDFSVLCEQYRGAYIGKQTDYRCVMSQSLYFILFPLFDRSFMQMSLQL